MTKWIPEDGQAFRDRFCAICLETLRGARVLAHRELFEWVLGHGPRQTGVEYAHPGCATSRLGGPTWTIDLGVNHESLTRESAGPDEEGAR